ncbi:DUF4833 domain-containing protein [Larkinella soli]|uniref:DUF4833 domain-containing protein n=1 Tax=Larkinella soli TaxID=1770527 RepID=UPI0013E34379|nr:DUF4833 domain-containing protein [Larkinella soli]
MKCIPALLLLIGLLAPLSTVLAEDPFPTPAPSANRLFYIQRSNNANTVIYEANLQGNRQLNPEEPLNVYWIRYAERSQREPLSMMQWKLAYGYRHQRQGKAADELDIRLNAFKKQAIRVAVRQGKPVALTSIGGRTACLQRVFVKVDPNSGLLPKVLYLELFGTDAEEGKPVYERINI